MINNKRGITVTSITVYVVLFFMFTTVTMIISSRFNEDLFKDRGTAINITAVNKLEYNLLKSAEDSQNVNVYKDNGNVILEFSNDDRYVFNVNTKAVYKNGGKIIDFLTTCDVRITDYNVKLDITLNKYTNEIKRTVIVNSSVINNYEKDNLIAHYDGINNTGTGYHDNFTKTWVDLSKNNLNAVSNKTFDVNAETIGWLEDGFKAPQATNTNGMTWFKAQLNEEIEFPNMTIEFSITPLSELGTSGSSYISPVRILSMDGNTVYLLLSVRKNTALMYFSPQSATPVFTQGSSGGIYINKDSTYTFTFVQDNLTTRSLYINGR